MACLPPPIDCPEVEKDYLSIYHQLTLLWIQNTGLSSNLFIEAVTNHSVARHTEALAGPRWKNVLVVAALEILFANCPDLETACGYTRRDVFLTLE